MSRHLEELVAGHGVWEKESASDSNEPDRTGPSRREWAVSFLLFVLTILSVSLAGLFYVFGIFFLESVRSVSAQPGLLLYGLQYSIPLIAVLSAHEMGHYLACRYYGIRCTPPYFLPIPVSITGTLGAFIKIKSPFTSNRDLFDVGIAGPLAGFIIAMPVLWIGIGLSRIAPEGSARSGELFFGEPLILRMLATALLDYDPAGNILIAHPIAMAGWFGLLVTSLNLLPVWQLDGGHISYAIVGPKLQKRITIAVLVLLMLLGLWGWPTPSYLFFGLLLFILGVRHGFYHPRTVRDGVSLGLGRKVLAIAAAIILILCFTPVPVSFT